MYLLGASRSSPELLFSVWERNSALHGSSWSFRWCYLSSASMHSWSKPLQVCVAPWVPATLAAFPRASSAWVKTCLACKVGSQLRALGWENGLQSKCRALPSVRKERRCSETLFLARRKAPAWRLRERSTSASILVKASFCSAEKTRRCLKAEVDVSSILLPRFATRSSLPSHPQPWCQVHEHCWRAFSFAFLQR